MFRITNILNPLTGGAATKEYKWEKGRPLSVYLGYDGECIVAQNRGIINLPLDEIFPARKDEYMIMPIPAGVDRQTWRVLGYMAMTAVSFIPGWGAAAALVGGNMINLFLQDKAKADQSTSQSYNWKFGGSPKAAYGSPMPIIYGKTRVRPVLKNRFVEVIGDKQYLSALYSIAAHKVDERTFGLPEYVYGGGVIEVKYQDQPGVTFFNSNWHREAFPERHSDYKKPIPLFVDKVLGEGWSIGYGTGAFYWDIIINGRIIQDYHTDIKWETRPGLAKQYIIEGFDATYSNFPQSELLYLDSPIINSKTANIRYNAINNRVMWDEHKLLLRGEEYIIQKDDKAFAPGETYYIYYAPSISTRKYYMKLAPPPTEGYIIASFETTATGIKNLEYTYPNMLPIDEEWFRPVVRFSSVHNIELMFEFPYGLYSDKAGADIVNATCRLFAQYREFGSTGRWFDFYFESFDEHVKSGKSDHYKRYADNTITAGILTRKTPKMFNISVKAKKGDGDFLSYDKEYEVRVCANSPCIVKIVNVAGIVYGEENENGLRPGLTYPGEPLLGIKALASGQISGDLDVQVDVERSKVWVYDGTNNYSLHPGWNLLPANNHAWAVYDILANGHYDHPAYPTRWNADGEAVYGCGIDHTRIDYDSFKEWADYVGGTDEGELGYQLNIVFDTFMTAEDAILLICQEGRGIIYPIGTKIFAMADKPGDSVQAFTMGNIHLDTFVQRYLGTQQKANMVEVKYWDAERNYEETTIAARTEDWDSSLDLNVPNSITLYGTTSYKQAYSIAVFMLLNNELINNVISFGVDVDALAAQVGDVVDVQHDVITTGQGGRIIGVEHNLVLNPSFESGMVGGKMGWTGGGYANNWEIWGNPGDAERRWVADMAKYGSHSYYHISTNPDAGISQTIDVTNGKTYTLSCWVYTTSTAGEGAGGIRMMTKAHVTYYSASAHVTGGWEQLSLTITPHSTSNNQLTVWLGGVGIAYFDGIIVTLGSKVGVLGTLLTFDRTLQITPGTTYELEIRHNDGSIEKESVTGNGDTTTIEWGDGEWDWDYVPEVYELYSFGIAGAHIRQYRITEISRTSELMRTLTLKQYDEDVYSGVTPLSEGNIGNVYKAAPPKPSTQANLLNLASNVQLQEIISKNRVTGEYESSILAAWDTVAGDPRGTWEIWFRDVDTSDTDWKGTWEEGQIYDLGDKAELGGKVYTSMKEGNISPPFAVEA